MTQTPRTNGRSASSSSVELVPIPLDGVLSAAPLVEGLLRPALDIDPTLTWQHVLGTALRGEYQWWVAWEPSGEQALAAIVTEIVDEPAARVARVLMAAGSDLQRWRHLVGKLEEWSRAQGAGFMEIHGRRGWRRVLDGYAEQRVVLRKDLA